MYFSLDLIQNVEKLFHFLHNLVHFEDGGCMGYIKVIKKIFVMIDINLRCVFKHFDYLTDSVSQGLQHQEDCVRYSIGLYVSDFREIDEF